MCRRWDKDHHYSNNYIIQNDGPLLLNMYVYVMFMFNGSIACYATAMIPKYKSILQYLCIIISKIQFV